MSHTIVMIQHTTPNTRTYSDYGTIVGAVNAIIKTFEEDLKKKTSQVTYEMDELYQYLDSLADISCLVFQKQTNTYAPHDKDWIKEKIYGVMRKTAMGEPVDAILN